MPGFQALDLLEKVLVAAEGVLLLLAGFFEQLDRVLEFIDELEAVDVALHVALEELLELGELGVLVADQLLLLNDSRVQDFDPLSQVLLDFHRVEREEVDLGGLSRR